MVVLRAIDDYLRDTKEVAETYAQKLRFADTDLSRYANAAMRIRLFAEYQRDNTREPLAQDADLRKPASVNMGLCDLAQGEQTY